MSVSKIDGYGVQFCFLIAMPRAEALADLFPYVSHFCSVDTPYLFLVEFALRGVVYHVPEA